MHGGGTQHGVEVVGRGAAVSGGEGDHAAAAVTLERPADTRGEGGKPRDLAEGWQDVELAAAVVRGHVAPAAHGVSGARVGGAQGSVYVFGALEPARQVTVVEGEPVLVVKR